MTSIHSHQNSNELFLRKNLPLERLNMYSHARAWEQEQQEQQTWEQEQFWFKT